MLPTHSHIHNLGVAQQTFASPGGSYTGSVVQLQDIKSGAGLGIAIGF